MMRRPRVIFPVGFWVLIAGFAMLRPLLHGSLRAALSAMQADVLLTILFLLVIVEAICLLQLRKIAIHIAVLILVLWTIIICTRIWFALKYSPLIFGRGPEGLPAYVAPAIAMLLNAAGIAVLIHPKFRAATERYRFELQHRDHDLENRLRKML